MDNGQNTASPNIIMVVIGQNSFVGEAVLSDQNRVVQLKRACQVFNSIVVTPNGPMVVTITPIVGEVNNIPEDAIVVETDAKSVIRQEYAGQWTNIKIEQPSKLASLSKLPPRDRQ